MGKLLRPLGLCLLIVLVVLAAPVGCAVPAQPVPGAGQAIDASPDERYAGVDDLATELERQQAAIDAGEDLEIDPAYDDRPVFDDSLADPDNVYDPDGEGVDGLQWQSLMPLAQPVKVPVGVDLRRYSKVLDQGRVGSCTAYATAGCMQVRAKVIARNDDISAEHLWNAQGKRANTTVAVNTALRTSLVASTIWPNVNYAKPKRSDYYRYGHARLVGSRALTTLAQIIASLAANKPVIAAAKLNDAWRYARGKGVINPNANATGTWQHAFHAFGLVGYRKDSRFGDGGYFIVKNSWATGWGDGGYGYLPFSYCRLIKRFRDGYCHFYSVEGVQAAANGKALPATGGRVGEAGEGAAAEGNAQADCFSGQPECAAGQVCSWNGSDHCCKAPWTGAQLCTNHDECGPGGICALGADETYYCTRPDAQACLR